MDQKMSNRLVKTYAILFLGAIAVLGGEILGIDRKGIDPSFMGIETPLGRDACRLVLFAWDHFQVAMGFVLMGWGTIRTVDERKEP